MHGSISQSPAKGVVYVRITQHSSARVVIAALTAVTAACSPEPMLENTIAVTPTASVATDAFGSHIALVSVDIACVPDSYQFRVKCYDRSGEMVGAWGREGEGPGEFLGSTLVAVVRRPPDRRGFSTEAIDWYDIGDVQFGPPTPAAPSTGFPESPRTARPG